MLPVAPFRGYTKVGRACLGDEEEFGFAYQFSDAVGEPGGVCLCR